MQRKLSIEARILAIVVGCVLGSWSWNAIQEYRARARAEAVMQSIVKTVGAAEQQSSQAMNADRFRRMQESQAVREAQLKREMYEHSRRMLAADQRCVGGVVVQVDGNTFTQIGSISAPVRCSGQLADRPVR